MISEAFIDRLYERLRATKGASSRERLEYILGVYEGLVRSDAEPLPDVVERAAIALWKADAVANVAST